MSNVQLSYDDFNESFKNVKSFEDFEKINKSGNRFYLKTGLEIEQYVKFLLSTLNKTKLTKNADVLINSAAEMIDEVSNKLRVSAAYLEYLIDLYNDGQLIETKKLKEEKLFDVSWAALNLVNKDIFTDLTSLNVKKVDTFTDVDSLKSYLQDGVVEFKYKKINGDIKSTKGTTNMSIIPADKHPNEPTLGKIVYSHLDETVKYYDLNANDWRSFRKENLILS